MRKLKEAARLHLELNLGVRPIARACNISTSTASVYVILLWGRPSHLHILLFSDLNEQR